MKALRVENGRVGLSDIPRPNRRGEARGLHVYDVARAVQAVLDAPVVTDSFASATTRQLVLAVPQDDEESLGLVLAASGDDRVRVVGRG